MAQTERLTEKRFKIWEKCRTNYNRDKLILAYMRLIHSRARYFYDTDSFFYDDLVTAGMMGVNKAIETYKENGFKKFNVFVNYKIKYSMIDVLRKVGNDRQMSEFLIKLQKSEYCGDNYQYIADLTGCDIETVDQYMMQITGKLNTCVSDLELPEKTKKTDFLLRDFLSNKLKKLNEYDKSLIYRRYYLDMTIEEIFKQDNPDSNYNEKVYFRYRQRLCSAIDRLKLILKNEKPYKQNTTFRNQNDTFATFKHYWDLGYYDFGERKEKCVYWDKKAKLWKAMFQHNRKLYYLGRFKEKKHAIDARRKKYAELVDTEKDMRCLTWRENLGKWHLRISHKNKDFNIGLFENLKEAQKVRDFIYFETGKI